MNHRNNRIHETPWLDRRGFPLTKAQLSFISRAWDAETWEQYLQWFETPLKESQVPAWQFDKIAEQQSDSIFASTQEDSDSDTRRFLQRLIDGLPIRQREVIELAYWDGLSEREIGERLLICRGTVRCLKGKAIKRLSAAIRHEGTPTFPLMRGQVVSLNNSTGGADDKDVLELAEGAIPQAG